MDNVILRFNKVLFEYGKKLILNEVDFSIRRGAKITLMGQNGAGKSTIFQLITRELKPEEGSISIEDSLTIATAKQVIPRNQMSMTVREFFESAFNKKIYDIYTKVSPLGRMVTSDNVANAVELLVPKKIVKMVFVWKKKISSYAVWP